MKVETNKVRNALLLLMTGAATLVAQPETAELREPEAIKVVKPLVSSEFARHGIEGRVDVTFRIDEQGRTRDIEVEGVLYHLPVVFN